MEENNELAVKRKMIFTYGGAMIGFFIVKALVFNGLEDMGWHLFWNAIFEGNITIDGLFEIITTSGFIKLSIGAYVGFTIGEWLENGTIKKYMDNVQADEEKGDTK